MPESLELIAEQILIMQEVFNELSKLAATTPGTLPVFMNGLSSGVSKFVHNDSTSNVGSENELAEVEVYAEQQQRSMFNEIFQENRQRFTRVYNTQKEALRKQWQNVTKEDLKDLILERKVKDFDVVSHVVRQRIVKGEIEEERLSRVLSTLALGDTLKLLAKTMVAGTFSSVAEYSEALGYCFAEQINMLSPRALSIVHETLTMFQRRAFQEHVNEGINKKGVAHLGPLPFNLEKHFKKGNIDRASLLVAIGSFPLSVLQYIAAGAYEGAYSVSAPEEKRSEVLPDIAKKIMEALKLKKEEYQYQKKSLVGKLRTNLQRAKSEMYSMSESAATRIRDDWNKAYSVALACYGKSDKKVAESMSRLLESNPYKGSSSNQTELAYRTTLREDKMMIAREELALLRSKESRAPEDIKKIEVLDKILKLDDLRKKTDSESKAQVLVLESELQGVDSIDSKLGYYDIARATVTAASLFTKAEVYAASRAITRTSISVLGNMAASAIRAEQYVNSYLSSRDKSGSEEKPKNHKEETARRRGISQTKNRGRF